MVTKKYEFPPTKGGYNYWEALSALQKFVRRGMEHEALFIATELYMSGYEENVWSRIRIMASEDIGLADPNIAMNIAALYSTYTAFKKKNNKHGPERLQFMHAMLMIVRAKKSRLIDNKLCYYFDLRDSFPKIELPDFIYDMHTRKGRSLKRGNDFFFKESAKISNENIELVPDEFEYRDKIAKLYDNIDNGISNKYDSEPVKQQTEFSFEIED